SRGVGKVLQKSLIFLDCQPPLPLTMGAEQEGRSASMTVKEVEERTGLPRANIRYYESEGLIHPARGQNGYRDYRQEDVDTLLKIKLLRQVGRSEEHTSELQSRF